MSNIIPLARYRHRRSSHAPQRQPRRARPTNGLGAPAASWVQIWCALAVAFGAYIFGCWWILR
jgi:hypothetical protein